MHYFKFVQDFNQLFVNISYPGRIIHSIDYKDPEHNDTIGKRILVIGIGNSAVDVAVDSVVDGKSNKVCLIPVKKMNRLPSVQLIFTQNA